jgi:hypothetical protein
MKRAHVFNNFHIQVWILFSFSLLLSGCITLNDPEASQEYNQQIVGTVNSNTTVGQIIRTNRDRMNGITFWLSQASPEVTSGNGYLTVKLFDTPTSNTPIFAISISTTSIRDNTPIFVTLPSTTLPGKTSFYVELSTPDNEIIVHGRTEDCYPRGQAYLNGEPLFADIAFRLSYSYQIEDFYSDIRTWVTEIKFLIPLLLTLWLPGYAFIVLFSFYKIYSDYEQFAISVGLSLALIPIFYLIGTVSGFRWTESRLYWMMGFFIIIVLFRWLSDCRFTNLLSFVSNPIQSLMILKNKIAQLDYLHNGLMLGIILFTLSVRMVMIRDLATPVWVDSIHHGLITRLIVENGTLPHTYQPYLGIEPTLYHPGFHTSLATFIQLSGLDISQGMLIFGQVLNTLIILSVYLLTTTLTRSRTAGMFAALIAGLFTPMPAYYSSWGRYPQLAGLIILPIPLSFIIKAEISKNKKQQILWIISAAIAFTGLLLVHYRAAAFFGCLLVGYLITNFIFLSTNRKQYFQDTLFRLGLFCLIVCITSSPWLIPALRFTFLPRITPIQTTEPIRFFSDFSWQYLTAAFGKQTLVMTALGMIWALIQNRKLVLVLTTWVVFLFFLANFDALNLPGGRFINNSSVTIMLFIPISMAGGYLLSQICELWETAIPRRLHIIFYFGLLVGVIGSALLGAQQLLPIINPSTILSRKSDLSAIRWIDLNIPDDQTILINPFAWGYGLYAGSDGGAWIPALAGNPTIPPPVLYGLGPETEISRINQICEDIFRYSNSPDELWNSLVVSNIEYIYIGARGGPLSANSLASNTHFMVIFQSNNTWVFQVLPANIK